MVNYDDIWRECLTSKAGFGDNPLDPHDAYLPIEFIEKIMDQAATLSENIRLIESLVEDPYLN